MNGVVAYTLDEDSLEYLYILPLAQSHRASKVTYIRVKCIMYRHIEMS
jgi:hypothetical protein